MLDPVPEDGACPDCEGRGWVILADTGAGTARPCDCRTRRLAGRLLAGAGIPERYAACTLENFRTDVSARATGALARARSRAKRYLDELLRPDGRFHELGLLLTGPPGTGKTHLAVAVLAGAVRRFGARGRFVDFTSLIHQIQATFDPGSADSKSRILDPIVGADLLVLDELGAQKPTAWVQNVLYLIINTRYTERRPTIFTTNYRVPTERPARPVAAAPPIDRAARAEREDFTLLEHRTSPQLVSRLYEMTEAIRLDDADDYRRAVKTRERHLVG
jgi:DNA replication protein DnaC